MINTCKTFSILLSYHTLEMCTLSHAHLAVDVEPTGIKSVSSIWFLGRSIFRFSFQNEDFEDLLRQECSKCINGDKKKLLPEVKHEILLWTKKVLLLEKYSVETSISHICWTKIRTYWAVVQQTGLFTRSQFVRMLDVDIRVRHLRGNIGMGVFFVTR